ncbi:hypothetical protein IKA15_06035 [bacterium]|nr:hypothetical protein [bacterium]
MIKKILTVLVLCFMLPASAQTFEEKYCAPRPYPVGGAVASGISNITGVNLTFTKLAELTIQGILKKELNSNFNVELYSFGGKNLIDGKFKKLTLSAKRIKSDDINLRNFYGETLCGYNRIVLKDDLVYFAENFLFGFRGKMTNEDFQNTILSEEYKKTINDVHLKLFGTSFFKLSNPLVEIKNNRIYMSVDVSFASFITSKTITVKTNYALMLQNGKIVISDVRYSDALGISKNAMYAILNILNPFKMRVPLDDVNTMTIYMRDFKIENDEINFAGVLLLPRSL